jgi:hypothetical protein
MAVGVYGLSAKEPQGDLLPRFRVVAYEKGQEQPLARSIAS